MLSSVHRHFQEGCEHHQRGRHAQALQCFDRVLEREPGHVLAHLNRGVVLQSLGRWQESVFSLTQALALDASSALGWSNLGVALKQLRQFPDALNCFDQALKLDADLAMAHNNRGVVLRDLLRFEESETSHRRAIALQPRLVSAWNNLGLALKEQGKGDEALQVFEQALALDARHVLAWCNKAVTLMAMDRAAEALACYEAASAIQPDFADLDWNKSQALLALGQFERGWTLFEARWRAQGTGMRLPYPEKRQWAGQPLAGKTLLVHHEQGLGDSIQFCRYLPMLAAQGATVVLEVPVALVRLMSRLEGVARVIERGQPAPDFDWHCPMMSLPGVCGTLVQSIPWSGPYLKADPVSVGAWEQRLGARRAPRVGWVWSGGFRPDQPELHATNQRRNVPLNLMLDLLRPTLTCYSLQKGAAAEQELAQAPEPLRAKVIDHTAHVTDFAETAALIEHLDLVISVDTSTAHLAAAMGKPVWLLNRFDSCWRWRLDEHASPWYPSLRLFTQAQPCDWAGVMKRVGQALDLWLADRSLNGGLAS